MAPLPGLLTPYDLNRGFVPASDYASPKKTEGIATHFKISYMNVGSGYYVIHTADPQYPLMMSKTNPDGSMTYRLATSIDEANALKTGNVADLNTGSGPLPKDIMIRDDERHGGFPSITVRMPAKK